MNEYNVCLSFVCIFSTLSVFNFAKIDFKF
jgi:hypothetical protein